MPLRDCLPANSDGTVVVLACLYLAYLVTDVAVCSLVLVRRSRP